MTRFQIFSDLHLEHRPWLADEISLCPDVDAVLLLGDIASGTEALAWLARLRPAHDRREILYLSGKHEAYGHAIERLAEEMACAVKATSVGLLAPGVRDVASARVIGMMLWTDHTISCRDKALEPKPAMMRQCIFANACQRAPNDFRWIRTCGRNISTCDVLSWYARDLVFIESGLACAAAEGVVAVVMTHHAPLRQSIGQIDNGDPMMAAFVSDLDAVARRHKPAAWVHGHIYTVFTDHPVGGIVVCNPAGDHPRENPRFDPDLVLEVDPVRCNTWLVRGP